jgi:ABC-type multidrug transport system permease subunit
MGSETLQLKVAARRKSGWLSALLNLFIPGAGYIYCGRWILGIVAFFFVVAMVVVSLGFAAFGIVFMLFIDGFLCANRYNKKMIEKLISEEDNKSISGTI